MREVQNLGADASPASITDSHVVGAAAPTESPACHQGHDGAACSWSLLDLTLPIRSQIFFNMVGDLLSYSGVNEVNVQVEIIRSVCRELCQQINEECLTFNYDDTCSVASRACNESADIKLLNRAIKRHPRLKFFECLLHSVTKFRVLLEDLRLPRGTWCSFILEFKVRASEIRRLLQRYRVRRLSIIPREVQDDSAGQSSDWSALPAARLRMLCLRSCTDDAIQSILASCRCLENVQITDSRLSKAPAIHSMCLTSLSLTGIVMMADEHFSKVIAGCQHLRSLYISKCHISHITVALPCLELLSVTHCRQLTDQCASEILNPCNNPGLRYVDLTENRGLLSPAVQHDGIEIAWLMHCTQLTDQAVTKIFENCPSLTAANLVQSSIESALICSPALRSLELATAQKLTDAAVTHLLQHCPSLTYLDVGHCSQLLEPRFTHSTLETILLSFCVNLREPAIVHMFANCPALRYVELAVCMFDMTRFQRECNPGCQVVVNFDF
mmetsp:Transcript_10767/g.19954  ORF Transcript_10767/g.19954 Transcript_10767/m.19954 type:complete len:500 (-) Transcript_10767:69-1568(-)